MPLPRAPTSALADRAAPVAASPASEATDSSTSTAVGGSTASARRASSASNPCFGALGGWTPGRAPPVFARPPPAAPVTARRFAPLAPVTALVLVAALVLRVPAAFGRLAAASVDAPRECAAPLPLDAPFAEAGGDSDALARRALARPGLRRGRLARMSDVSPDSGSLLMRGMIAQIAAGCAPLARAGERPRPRRAVSSPAPAHLQSAQTASSTRDDALA